MEFKSVSDQCCCSSHLLGFTSMFVNRENAEWRGPRLLNVAPNAFDIKIKKFWCYPTDP